eukprot:3517402-Prymnesium_polylepis.1
MSDPTRAAWIAAAAPPCPLARWRAALSAEANVCVSRFARAPRAGCGAPSSPWRLLPVCRRGP